MFHPLYNKDNKISVFRVFCLLIVAMCMLSLAYIRQDTINKENLAKSLSIIDAESKRVSLVIKKQKEKEMKEHLASNRNSAIKEVYEAAKFLSNCGTMNLGYVGCKLTFTDKLLSSYKPTISSFDDGYTISLKAVGFQKKDSCVLININSQGLFEGLDKSGKIVETCIPDKYINRQISSIRRATDDLDGMIAPSGLKPIYK